MEVDGFKVKHGLRVFQKRGSGAWGRWGRMFRKCTYIFSDMYLRKPFWFIVDENLRHFLNILPHVPHAPLPLYFNNKDVPI